MSRNPKTHVPFSHIFKNYAVFVLKQPLLLCIVAVATLSILAIEVIAPIFVSKLFNVLSGGTASQELQILVGIIALFYTGEWLFRRIQSIVLSFFELKVMTALYANAFEYLIGHSYHYFTSQFSGTLTRRVSKYVRAFESLFDIFIFQFIPTSLFVGGVIIVLSLRNATLGAGLFAWVLVFTVVQLLLAKKRQPLREAASDEDSKVVGNLADAISNQNTITLFSGKGFEAVRFANTIAKWRGLTLRAWMSDEMTWAVLGLLMISIEVGLLYGAVHYWQQGLLTVGDFALIQVYLIGTIDRLLSINRTLRDFYDAVASASEMIAILDLPHEIQDVSGAKNLLVSSGRIEFSKVGFSFTAGKKTLAEFDLAIAPKEKIALVGPSGAGKSTVTRLLLRFYDVQEGTITIDGQDIRLVTQDSLRDAVAYVPQEPILFHRTLLENIQYGRRDATREEIIEAAKRAHCHEFISALPQGYETFVGERGIKLSGGERQRVAIARAILKNAPILILDEATSSLDSESEALIQDAFTELMKNKTVIAIAHRLSTVMKMDRIVVIENGTASLSGTHDELIAHKGNLYKKLWEIQAGGFLEEGAV